jgi:hypothetical protein
VPPRKGVTLSATKTNWEESTMFFMSSAFNFTAVFEEEQPNKISGINKAKNKTDAGFSIFLIFMFNYFLNIDRKYCTLILREM